MENRTCVIKINVFFGLDEVQKYLLFMQLFAENPKTFDLFSQQFSLDDGGTNGASFPFYFSVGTKTKRAITIKYWNETK